MVHEVMLVVNEFWHMVYSLTVVVKAVKF